MRCCVVCQRYCCAVPIRERLNVDSMMPYVLYDLKGAEVDQKNSVARCVGAYSFAAWHMPSGNTEQGYRMQDGSTAASRTSTASEVNINKLRPVSRTFTLCHGSFKDLLCNACSLVVGCSIRTTFNSATTPASCTVEITSFVASVTHLCRILQDVASYLHPLNCSCLPRPVLGTSFARMFLVGSRDTFEQRTPQQP